MADLARSYHQNLQNDARPPPSEEEREEQIKKQLDEIPATQTLENPAETRMNGLIDENSVRNALNLTRNKTATGTDGCLYELWKAINKRYDEDISAGKEGFNIIKILTIVY